jgi:transcriptional regulator with XRE-family HTH domain
MSDVTLDSFTSFGELLRYLRRRARLTQDEFGLAVGYSLEHVARLENGQRWVDFEQSARLFGASGAIGESLQTPIQF